MTSEDSSAPKAGTQKERRVWRVSFHPGKGAQMVLLNEEAISEVQNGEERVGFLPQWYWDEIISPEPSGSVE